MKKNKKKDWEEFFFGQKPLFTDARIRMDKKTKWAIFLFIGGLLLWFAIYIIILSFYETVGFLFCLTPIPVLLIPLVVYFYDKIKEFLICNWNKVMCVFKGHNVVVEVYEKLSNDSCRRTTWCKRCDSLIKSEILPHDITNENIYFLPSVDGCIKMSNCKNCYRPITLGMQEHEVTNAITYFKPSDTHYAYSTSVDCMKMANCEICNTPILLGIQAHQYQTLEQGCETIGKCNNCNVSQVLKDHHDYVQIGKEYGPWVYEGLIDREIRQVTIKLRCKACGKEKVMLGEPE